MYKIDKTKIYSVIDVFNGNFTFTPGLKGYFANTIWKIKSDEIISNHYELEHVSDSNNSSDSVFKASNGKWFAYFIPEDAVEIEPEKTEKTEQSSKITLRNFLGLFDKNLKNKRRIKVNDLAGDIDDIFNGLVEDVPENILDKVVVNFSTFIDDGYFAHWEPRDYDAMELKLETVLSVFVED